MKKQKLLECFMFGLLFSLFAIIPASFGAPLWQVILFGVGAFFGGFLIPYLGEGGTEGLM